MAAKEQWKEMGNVPAARQILAEAFAANPDSEVSSNVRRRPGKLCMQGLQASFAIPDVMSSLTTNMHSLLLHVPSPHAFFFIWRRTSFSSWHRCLPACASVWTLQSTWQVAFDFAPGLKHGPCARLRTLQSTWLKVDFRSSYPEHVGLFQNFKYHV